MRKLILTTKADLINLIKNPMWIFFASGFPILLVVILGFLTKDNYGGQITSYDYYGITLMIYSILSSAMISSNAFMEEKIKKANMRIIYAPGSIKSIFLSKIIASFIFTSIFHLFDMILLYLIYNIHLDAVPHLICLFGLTELFSVTLGIMLCCIFKSEAITNQILGIVINIIAILGGLMFSLDGYGSVMRKISASSPAKMISSAAFQMIYDNNFNLFIPMVISLIIIIVIMIILCNILFRKEDCIC